MARLDNWQSNLTNLIEEKKSEPGDFPRWNCLMWAIEAVKVQIGIDLGINYRGKYKDEKSALKLLKKVDNVKTCQELLEKYLGESRPIALGKRGDIVFADMPEDRLFGLIPGVCYGQYSYFVGEQGLVTLPTLQLKACIWVS